MVQVEIVIDLRMLILAELKGMMMKNNGERMMIIMNIISLRPQKI